MQVSLRNANGKLKTYDISSKVKGQKHPWNREWRCKILSLGKPQLDQSDRNQSQEKDGWVSIEADNKVKCIARRRSTDKNDGDSKMDRKSRQGSLEWAVLHENIGKGSNAVFGQFLENSGCQCILVSIDLVKPVHGEIEIHTHGKSDTEKVTDCRDCHKSW